VKPNFYSNIIKPFFDFNFAIIIFLAVSPILLLTAITLMFANNGSIFFFQTRPGKNAIPFRIIKFKTMRDAYDINGKLLADELRITKVGYFIRSSSIDELLQLINVIKGDMSFVGPRPLLMKYLSLYTEEQTKRHLVKPGITGLAQINGRNAISWNQKFYFDVEYVKKQSFKVDLYILFKTFISVLARKGITAIGHVTTEEFKGQI
jgi:undecaprenyl phosphate N,N'-diacetylbacillosamine 1-phosphate transferase